MTADSKKAKPTTKSNYNCEELEQLLAEKNEAHKRVLADYDNLLKRTSHERQQVRELITQQLIGELLPTLDHLEMAQQHFQDGSLKMICDEFKRTLEQYGLQRMDAVGAAFDPQTMEVVDTEASSKEYPPHTVIRETLPGYLVHNTVLRHAKVIVAAESEM